MKNYNIIIHVKTIFSTIFDKIMYYIFNKKEKNYYDNISENENLVDIHDFYP